MSNQSKSIVLPDDTVFVHEIIPLEGQQGYSIILPLYVISDSCLRFYTNRYVKENWQCFASNQRKVISVYNYGKNICIGMGDPSSYAGYNVDGIAKFEDVEILISTDNPDKFFYKTGDSIKISNLYTFEQFIKAGILPAQDDSKSQWEFELKKDSLIPHHIYIEAECSTTTIDSFSIGTEIVH